MADIEMQYIAELAKRICLATEGASFGEQVTAFAFSIAAVIKDKPPEEWDRFFSIIRDSTEQFATSFHVMDAADAGPVSRA